MKPFLRILHIVFLGTLGAFVTFSTPTNAQSAVSDSLTRYYRYDKDLLTKEFHQGRRAALREMMPAKSVAVFFAAPIRNRSHDDDYNYHQNPDFYYLSGFNEPDAILLVMKDSVTIGGQKANEFIFVSDRDKKAEIWTGRKLGKLGAASLLGISAVLVHDDFDKVDIAWDKFDKLLYAPLPKGAVDVPDDKYDLYDLILTFKRRAKFPSESSESASLIGIMAKLRQEKLPEELTLMRKAIGMTCIAEQEVMKSLVPGLYEYQVQAILEYIFKTNGSEYVGFPSICGGGENSCVLHYESNRKQLEDGNLIVIDIGAEYHGYSADVTRTIPVNGKYSDAQKEIYELVYEAQAAGIRECRPGVSFWAPHLAAHDTIAKGLIRLGIIKNEWEVESYFMHGTSHYLGLDVHDAGTYLKLKEGDVITVEPGIYIPEGSPCDKKYWNTGVRIEDDVLITGDSCEVLSAAAPRKVAQIEALMQQIGMFKPKK